MYWKHYLFSDSLVKKSVLTLKSNKFIGNVSLLGSAKEFSPTKITSTATPNVLGAHYFGANYFHAFTVHWFFYPYPHTEITLENILAPHFMTFTSGWPKVELSSFPLFHTLESYRSHGNFLFFLPLAKGSLFYSTQYVTQMTVPFSQCRNFFFLHWQLLLTRTGGSGPRGNPLSSLHQKKTENVKRSCFSLCV